MQHLACRFLRFVRLYANYADQKVIVQQVGIHPSGLNGYKTEKDVKIIAQHGDTLEILYGKYPYQVEFNPPPTRAIGTGKPEKRLRLADSDGEESKDKKLKKEFDFDSDEDSFHIDLPESCPDSEGDILSRLDKDLKMDDSGKGTESKILSESSKNSEPTDADKWEESGKGSCLVFTSKGVQGRSKIAAYDMDKTLIKTQSGRQFPQDANDWQLWHPEVPGKLKKLHADGYKIVIFTNQASLGTGKVKPSDFKLKIERIVKKIGIPIQVFIAVGYSKFRKPCTGMWDLLVQEKNDGVAIKKEQCLYVGDAAGRPEQKESKRKKDHSLADRLLAINVGLDFYTPEEHFLGHKVAKYNPPAFHPKDEVNKKTHITDPPNAEVTKQEQEVIVMVGSPGSGKSHFAKTYLTGYHYVNRDTLGSWQKCVAETEKALVLGKSVVVDNTNPDEISRLRYIEVGKKHNVPVRCFVMAMTKEHTKHNNKFRCLTDPNHQKISDMILHSYANVESQLIWRCLRFVKLLLLLCLQLCTFFFTNPQPYRKSYKMPNLEEGFAEIVKVNFVPKFETEEARKLYEMYLLEE
ncbi:uncharacterized protein F21D5.5 isoform X3 [Belonocnema kinseyi]|uniref:uncharacterized protein F21D5.5 isoform X3 n=1 Tax=Belonocnema kinseyi TaxID=2817044 RepID=UPI00143D6BBE|nr:uncharacterized protein F21D5.5 isoform X3 [Belonocnema kinseyi]